MQIFINFKNFFQQLIKSHKNGEHTFASDIYWT